MLSGEKLEIRADGGSSDSSITWRRDIFATPRLDASGQMTANNAVADGEDLVVHPAGNEIKFEGAPGLRHSAFFHGF
jgi:hypothetical protein